MADDDALLWMLGTYDRPTVPGNFNQPKGRNPGRGNQAPGPGGPTGVGGGGGRGGGGNPGSGGGGKPGGDSPPGGVGPGGQSGGGGGEPPGPDPVLPPAYADFANVMFLSTLSDANPVDESDQSNNLTAVGDAAPDAGELIFEQPMMQFDGTGDRVAQIGPNSDFKPFTNPFAGFVYFKTPATWTQGGVLMTYIEKVGGQWRTYWQFDVGADGKLSFGMWTGLTGGGFNALVDTVALETDTLYLVGFSKSTWTGAGHKNRKLFAGKVGVDEQCVIRAEVEQDINTSNTNPGDGPDFALGYYLLTGVPNTELIGHLGEAVFLNGEDYVTEAFDMPTVGWPRS